MGVTEYIPTAGPTFGTSLRTCWSRCNWASYLSIPCALRAEQDRGEERILIVRYEIPQTKGR